MNAPADLPFGVEHPKGQCKKQPVPGTYAFTACILAEMFPDFDWDEWKDEAKERDLL